MQLHLIRGDHNIQWDDEEHVVHVVLCVLSMVSAIIFLDIIVDLYLLGIYKIYWPNKTERLCLKPSSVEYLLEDPL